MTLIVLILKENDCPIAIGDLAISSETGEPLSLDDLPFQRLKDPGLSKSKDFAPAKIVSLSQKVVRFGPHLILWAGVYLYARSAINELYRQRHRLSYQNIETIIKTAIGEYVSEVDLIYCKRTDEGLEVWQHNCSIYESSGSRIIVSGSGEYRFTTEFEAVFDEELPNLTTNFRQAALRISHMIGVEITDPTAYSFGVGGGYEVLSLAETGWKPLPYNVLFAVGGESGFGLRRLLTYSYLNHHLCADVYWIESQCLASWDADSPWRYIMDISISQVDRFIVQDFLRRDTQMLGSVSGCTTVPNRQSNLMPEFSIVNLHKVEQATGSGPAVWWSYTPAVISGRTDPGGPEIACKAFFLREVEEWFIGRSFTPPEDYVHHYAEQRRLWKGGKSLVHSYRE